VQFPIRNVLFPYARFTGLLRHDGRSQGFYRYALAGMIPFQQFRQAYSDKDGTVDKTEFQSNVEKLFQNANKDHDGTLDKKEFGSSAGRIFLGLFVVRQGPVI
jgi:hypothetical protein